MERKSTWSRLTLPRHQVVRRASRALLICLFSLVFVGVLLGQEDDPSELFLKAYLTAQQGEKLEHEDQFKTALAKLRFAGSLIEELRRSHPDWQPAIVEYRGRKIGQEILKVQERISRHNGLNAAASPLPEIVPSLPESEAWSEPGPEVVAPQGVDTIPQGSSGAAIEDATRKLRRKVDQLQAALEQSRSDLETARKEKEAVNKRLQETSSKLDDAQKEVETSKQLQAQIADLKNEVAVAQEARATAEKQRDEANSKFAEATKQIGAAENLGAEALAQLKLGSETGQHTEAFLAETGDLKLMLANAENNVRKLDEGDSADAKKLARVKQQVTDLQQQLVDGQKQNQYLVARIAELSVQLDENGAQLQNTRLTGKDVEETTRLMKENELLRNIVVRERQEEARRDAARKLMLAELDKLKIKSDALNQEVEFLARPVTTLSSEELSLLRQPVVSVSDQNHGALTASFIFAKKSAGNLVQGEAATDNSGRLKGDVRDASQSVTHAAVKEDLSGASSEPQKAVAGNPDQGSE